MQGIFLDVPAFHEPSEESVEAAVLSIDVAFGQLLGDEVLPGPELPSAALEVGQVFLDVLGGDVLHIGPALFLGIEGGHGDRGFEAG